MAAPMNFTKSPELMVLAEQVMPDYKTASIMTGDRSSLFWKVIVVLPNGSDDLNRVTTATRVISVIMPNSNTIGNNWRSYRVSVNDVEGATGYDLLSQLPASIQDFIEARVDNL